MKRAGLDYWEHVDLRVWPDWDDVRARAARARRAVLLLDERATRAVGRAARRPQDVVLVFGRETGGLPAELHERYRDRFVGMPILSPHVRSLNLSTSVGIAVYEVLRQRR